MNSYLKKILVLTLIVILAFPVGAEIAPITRISGAGRYATAVEVSEEGWITSSVVVIARGDDYADALAGVPLAYRLGAPILLVAQESLPAVTRQEIRRLGASQAIILGGEGAVNSDVANALKGMGLDIERIAGTDRFDTAARIASRVAPNGTQAVVVASGRNFPDALSAAPYAAVAGYPVLLVERNSVPAIAANAIRGLGVTETIVVGGTGVVSSDVMSKLPGAHRISGADRYATSVALAKHFNPLGEDCFVATGRGFADAITGAVLAARRETGILLVGTSLPGAVRTYLDDSQIKQACVLGGTGAVSATVAKAILNILSPPAEAGITGVTGWTTPGAKVTIAGTTVLADDEGKYQVSGLTVGKHTAVFSLDGYNTESISVNVAAEQYSVLNADLEILYPEKIYLSGVVVDKATGRPLVGANVGIETLSSGEWVYVTERKTDSNGVYTVANTDGDEIRFRFGDKVRLTVRKDSDEHFREGYHPVVLTLTLKQDDVANIVDGVEMSRIKPIDIFGRVTEPDGRAVTEVAVTLYNGDRFISGVTNAQGDYSFQNITLPSGKYVILVDYVGNSDYAMYCRDISVTEGRDLTHNIRMVQGYKVDVEVKAEKDGEIFKAGPSYNAVLLQGGVSISADTASIVSNGEVLSFAWNRVAPGSYTVEISGDYVVTKTFTIRVYNLNYSSINQRVTRAGVITGTVKIEGDESALEGARVELLSTSGSIVASAVTGTDGKYCIGGLTGGSKYIVRASAPGYRTRTSNQLLVEVNEERLQDIILPMILPTADVSGTVRTASTLSPAAGAEICFRALSVHGYGRGEEVDSTAVGADGGYQINLIPGAYTVVISNPGKHETLETILTVAAGDELEYQNYILQPGGNARLTVTVEDSLNQVIKDVDLTDKWGDPVAGSYSDGKTVFANLSAGTYTVSAQGDLHEDLMETVTVAKGAKVTRSFTLIASSKVHDVYFWVVGEYNHSLSDVRVIIMSGTEEVADGLTNDSGKLPVRLPSGSYKALIYADGYILTQEEFNVANRAIVIPVIRLDRW